MHIDVQATVIQIISELLNMTVSEVPADAQLVSDLGFDSMDHIDLLITLEYEFEIEISDEGAERFRNATAQEIAAAISNRLKTTTKYIR